MLLLLVLEEVFRDAAEQSTSDRAQEAMSALFAQVVAAEATSDGAKETTITLGHGRSVGVVVRSILIGRLACEFVVGRNALLLLALLLLVGLVLSVGVISSVLLLLLALVSVVSRVTLRVAGVVGAELVLLLAVLETTLLGRTEGVLTAWWAEALVLRWVLLVALLAAVLLVLIVALLGRIATLLLAVALLRVL